MGVAVLPVMQGPIAGTRVAGLTMRGAVLLLTGRVVEARAINGYSDDLSSCTQCHV